jgi:uncharacterized protein YlzI (FlbEa/FlbD family)
MKIIKLTGTDGNPVFLNTDFIGGFIPVAGAVNPQDAHPQQKTSLMLTNGTQLAIRETPEEIYEIVHGMPFATVSKN